MKHAVYKIFFIWEHEKEENWLNEMSAKGLQLDNVGFCRYVFKDAEPASYNYRIELLNNLPSHAKSIAYIRFLEETGVEHIGSYFRWVYFRKKTADGPFNIYSDLQSKITHYRRILYLLLGLIPLSIFNLFNFLPRILSSGRFSDYLFCFLFLWFGILIGKGIFSMTKKIRQLNKETSITE
ncbi:MAG: DUF2812 domain-containing protein [Dethiobacteria bacterium]|nr:DUF2812 domain-containing protein [Dethiobacteria bacterium]